MTVKAQEWAWRQADCTLPERAVLGALGECINKDHEFCWPSQDWLSKRVARQPRQVRNILASLEAKHKIFVVAGRGAGRGMGRASDNYFLACDHRTGKDRPIAEVVAACGTLTSGNLLPPVKRITAGNQLPPANDITPVTGGNIQQLQAAISGFAYKEEPELEPEKKVVGSPPAPIGAPAAPKRAPLNGKIAIEQFCEFAERNNWVAAKAPLSEARKKAIKAKLRAFGMEGWLEQLKAAAEQTFLGGDNDRGWRMNLDWFVTTKNWSKVAERAYASGKGSAPKAVVDAAELRRRIANYRCDGTWLSSWGPKPDAATLAA